MAVSLTIAITQNSQSIANNTSNVTVTVTAKWTGGSYNQLQKSGWLKIDGTKYSFTSYFNYNKTTSGSQTIFSKTVDVDHNSDGTKTLSCSASYTTGVSSGTITASASKALTTIPRKSTLAASNGTLGTAQTLTVTRKSTSFTHTITYTCGSASGTICTKSSSTSVSWTPPLSLASQNTTGSSVSVKLTITTYSGSTSVGSNTKTITCTIPTSVKPTVSVTLTDPTGAYDTFGYYVQGQSKVKIAVSASGIYSSTIKSYKITFDGKTYTSSSPTTSAISGSGTMTIKVVVTDSRGASYATTVTKTISVTKYSRPAISTFNVYRCDAAGTSSSSGAYLAIAFAASITSLDGQNSATYTLKYKRTDESSYCDLITLTDDEVGAGLYVFAADTSSSYNITFAVADYFNETPKTGIGSSVKKFWSWYPKGLGLALGKLAEHSNVFEVAFQTLLTGGLRHPLLEPETDLNDIRTPNTYVGENLTTYNYTCGGGELPLSSGTFTLEVVGMGDSGQVKQRLTYCHKTDARAWERIYYGSVWGDWFCVSDFKGQLLWDGSTLDTGGYYMSASHTIALSAAVSAQKTGIVLVFSEYDYDDTGAALNQTFHTRFIPKLMVTLHNGKGHTIQLSSSNMAYFGTKYLYVSDTQITGHDNNSLAATTGECGITYTNKRFVLRYVIGV